MSNRRNFILVLDKRKALDMKIEKIENKEKYCKKLLNAFWILPLFLVVMELLYRLFCNETPPMFLDCTCFVSITVEAIFLMLYFKLDDEKKDYEIEKKQYLMDMLTSDERREIKIQETDNVFLNTVLRNAKILASVDADNPTIIVLDISLESENDKFNTRYQFKSNRDDVFDFIEDVVEN